MTTPESREGGSAPAATVRASLHTPRPARAETAALIQHATRKRNKYGARKVTVDGHRFDSKREAYWYSMLRWQEHAGDIARLTVHPKWRIAVNGEHIADYTADFSYVEVDNGRHDRLVVVDVKSPATAKRRDFMLIRKLMWAVHRVDVEVWK